MWAWQIFCDDCTFIKNMGVVYEHPWCGQHWFHPFNCEAFSKDFLMVVSLFVGILRCSVVTGWSFTTPENLLSTWHATGNLLYASAISTHSWRNSFFLSEVHSWRYEEPSYWNLKTVPHAGGIYLIFEFHTFAFVLPLASTHCIS